MNEGEWLGFWLRLLGLRRFFTLRGGGFLGCFTISLVLGFCRNSLLFLTLGGGFLLLFAFGLGLFLPADAFAFLLKSLFFRFLVLEIPA